MNTTTHTAATPSLNIAYEQTGPISGEPILLLHGFPYDVREYDDVVERLAEKGCRLIVPWLRGFGPTRYANSEAMRSGQQAALGKDVVDLLDALQIDRATLVGYDWGGRGACVAAALWPERVRALVSIGGYNIQNIAKSVITPQDPEHEHELWYQWYFQTERGRLGLEQHRDELCKLLWSLWSPLWHFSEELFESTAQSFRNPDFVATVIHSYRHRYRNAPGDPALEALEERLQAQPGIATPTVALYGKADRVEPPPLPGAMASHFTGFFEERFLDDVGHCSPKEAPDSVSDAIEHVLQLSATAS